MRSIRRTLRLIPALLIGAMFATGVGAGRGASDPPPPTKPAPPHAAARATTATRRTRPPPTGRA
jgi:hypothetical protein